MPTSFDGVLCHLCFGAESVKVRGYHGTFHHFSKKHMDKYINEFTTRYNLRSMDTLEIMMATVKMMEGKRLTYRGMIDGEDVEPTATA